MAHNTKGKKFDKKTAAIAIVFIAVVAAIGIYSRRETLFQKDEKPSAEAAAAIVKTEIVRTDSTIEDKIVQNVSLEAEKRVKLLPRVTGRLISMSVKTGDRVSKGQQIAMLEHEQQDALILSTAAQASSARADTQKAKALMQNAATNYERYKRLEEEGFSTKQQLETMQTEYTSAAAAYDAAKAKERQYDAEAARVASAKNDYIITSPMDGIVLNDYEMTAGAMISPSSPIVEIADMGILNAKLKIPDTKIYTVKIGMPVQMKFDALPDRIFNGKITQIDQYVDPSTRTSKVEAAIDNIKEAGGILRPGIFGEASIIEKEYKNVVTVPTGALHDSDKSRYVFIVKNGKAEICEVKTGAATVDRVQITDGLSGGEEVIIFGG
ncbi:MAG: efflux RND transporter periplasmic adaptor subunit, partial [Synergistes sp.]|nr:efflux RND transporter periplasmic adaptor subunit [Synergistes sp.]